MSKANSPSEHSQQPNAAERAAKAARSAAVAAWATLFVAVVLAAAGWYAAFRIAQPQNKAASASRTPVSRMECDVKKERAAQIATSAYDVPLEISPYLFDASFKGSPYLGQVRDRSVGVCTLKNTGPIVLQDISLQFTAHFYRGRIYVPRKTYEATVVTATIPLTLANGDAQEYVFHNGTTLNERVDIPDSMLAKIPPDETYERVKTGLDLEDTWNGITISGTRPR